MRKLSARISTDEKKQQRLDILSSHLIVSDRVVTGDEITWSFQNDPETKLHGMQWKTESSPRPKKSRITPP